MSDASPQRRADATEEAATGPAIAMRKPSKPRAKLTTDKLCAPEGLMYLFQEGPKLQFRGKGFETEDLQKLIRFYQTWAHRVFPNLRFPDFIQRTQKLCRERRMRVHLQGMRTGVQSVLSGQTVQDKGFDFGVNDDVDNQPVINQDAAELQARIAKNRQAAVKRRRQVEQDDDAEAFRDAESTAKRPALFNPFDDEIANDDEEAMEALMQEEQQQAAVLKQPAFFMDDDEDEFPELGQLLPKSRPSSQLQNNKDEMEESLMTSPLQALAVDHDVTNNNDVPGQEEESPAASMAMEII